MKKDQNTLAHINLFAVLKSIVHLYKLDKEVRDLVGDKNISIQFKVKNGPSGALIFKNGTCTFVEGKHKKSTILLYFTSPSHFNNMVDGKSNPIPLKGITKLGFLTKKFTKITDKLDYYLRPKGNLLENKEYAKMNTILTFYVAFNALCQIGNTDSIGKYISKRLSDGNVYVTVGNDEKIYVNIDNHILKAHVGEPDTFQVKMEMADYETANGMLNGILDSYTCIGRKKLKISGFVPLIETMNDLLYRTTLYMKEEAAI